MLQFSVANTVSGATVNLYADGQLIGTAVASGSVTVVTTSGSLDLADGVRAITVRQTESGEPQSAESAALSVTIDTVAPSVAVNRAGGQASRTNSQPVLFSASFSKAVSGFGPECVAVPGTAAGAQVTSVAGSGAAYTVTEGGMVATGTVIASIPAGVVQDVAGNLNLASTSTDNIVLYEQQIAARFDFGTATSPVQAGYLQVTQATVYGIHAGNLTYGWQSGSILSTNRTTGTALQRDINYTRDGTFAVAVPNGSYQVTVMMGDVQYAHDRMGVFLEGVQVDDITTNRTVVSRTYNVTVADGQLTLRLRDLGGVDPNTTIAGLEVISLYTGPQLSIAPASVVEGYSGTTNLTFSVTLSQPIGQDLTVDYATADGTASAGSDYLPVSGTLRIAAGQTSGTISVPIINSWTIEPNQTLLVNLTNSSGIWIAASQAPGTILNHSAPPGLSVSIAPGSFSEAAGPSAAVGTVTRIGPTDAPLTVALASGDTGELTVPDSVTIGAGQTTATFAVSAVDDTVWKGTQTVTVSASASSYTSGSTAVQVTDNEQPPFAASFDFGTSTLPVQAGYLQVTQATRYGLHAANLTYGWQSGTILSTNRTTGTALERDINYTRDGTFAVAVSNGSYQVTVMMGDVQYAHDRMGVFLEGVQVDDITTNRTVVSRTYNVTVADGQLTLRLRDLGGVDPNTTIAGLTVVSAPSGLGAPAAKPLGAVSAGGAVSPPSPPPVSHSNPVSYAAATSQPVQAAKPAAARSDSGLLALLHEDRVLRDVLGLIAMARSARSGDAAAEVDGFLAAYARVQRRIERNSLRTSFRQG